jgi:hypothetical protein
LPASVPPKAIPVTFTVFASPAFLLANAALWLKLTVSPSSTPAKLPVTVAAVLAS